MIETVILSERLTADPTAIAQHTLSLTAEERTRSRHWFTTDAGLRVAVQLPRGTVLYGGDLLRSPETETLVRVQAKAEPVLTITASHPLEMARAAYHLGNRHVSLEITTTYLRLSPDPVLADLLRHLGVSFIEEVAPFQPEPGAYAGHHHAGGQHHAH